MSNGRYPNLLSPFELGPRTARNRVWMTAHATQLVKGHNFSDEHVAYYEERAKGGVGVITMEAMAVHETTQPYEGKIFAFDEAIVPAYQKMVDAVRPHGTLLLAQLWHRGRQTDSVVSRRPVWAPSAVPCSVYREIPHEMTVDEIDEMVESYKVSAEHAVSGGLDGIEIHGLAHGYLLGQFLSTATNHRDDDYGGSFENRTRIVLRIIQAVREVTPSDMILGIRINGSDGDHPDGLSNSEWGDIAELVESTGALDYISVSSGTYLDRMRIYGAAPTEPGFQLPDTARISERVELPTVAAGRIVSPEMAESLIAEGTATFAGMARQLIADPMWVRKAEAEQPDDIRPCVGANWCLSAIVKAPLACAHNPAVGRELELGVSTLEPAASPLDVAIVGGGPAGLRAALTAAQRGHRVTLLEREEQLGGKIRWISQNQSYREWAGIVDWLEQQLGATDAEVRLGVDVGADELAELGVDHVILATGSAGLQHGWTALNPAGWRPGAEAIPGMDQFNVTTVDEVFLGQPFLGESIVVYDDLGDRQAIVVAELLQSRGHNVTIATRLAQVAPDLAGSRDQGAVHKRLRTAGVQYVRDVALRSLEGDRALFRDVYSSEEIVLEPVDSLVLSTARRAEVGLVGQLEEASVPFQVIGDAQAPRRIFNAIYEGELAARAV